MFSVFSRKSTLFSTMTKTRSVVSDRFLLLLFDVNDHKHYKIEDYIVDVIYISLNWVKGRIILLYNQPVTSSMKATTESQ